MAYKRYIYKPINWINKSESMTTPVGKMNLNHMDSAIYNIAENLDIVYNEMSTGKIDKTDANKLIVGMPAWNPDTGVLVFHFYDGTTFQIDFNIEKIPVSFSMDSAGVITMTTADGTEWTADIGDVIPTYTYEDSDTIAFSDTKDGDYGHVISAELKKNSITGEYLQPDYLSDVTEQASNAAASAQSASDYADNADIDAKLAQSYAIGGSGIREGENDDCAKKYKEQAEQSASEAAGYLADMQSEQVTGVKGNAENSFRKGNVNLTAQNIGALATSGGTITGTTIFSKTQDLSGTADNRPALIVGGTPEQKHIEIDNNKIQAKNNGTTPTDIYINSDGGNLVIGGHINGATKQCSYLDAKSVDNALLFDRSGCSKNPDSYYPMLAQYATSGIFWSLGVHGKDIVLCGISKDRTINGYEWRITVDSTTGAVSFPNSVSATSFSGNATSATNADKLDGYHGSVDATASTYVLRNASNYIYVNYINSNTVNNENASISQIITTNGTDNYYRKSSLQQLINSIGLGNYLPLSGGTMTGDLSFNGAHTISSSGLLTLKGINAAVQLGYDGTARFAPGSNGGATLGSSSLRWGQIYSTNSMISTSDRREKYDISYIGKNSEYDTQLSEEQLEKFMMGLLPCVYKLIDGTSGRPHHGLIAQDIEALMDEIGLTDHAAFIKSPKTKEVEIEKEIEEEEVDQDTGEKKTVKKIVKELQREEIPGEYIYSLRYEEFIADIIRFIQLQDNRINDLENRIAVLEMLVNK